MKRGFIPSVLYASSLLLFANPMRGERVEVSLNGTLSAPPSIGGRPHPESHATREENP